MADQWATHRANERDALHELARTAEKIASIAREVSHWADYPGGGFASNARYQKVQRIDALVSALQTEIDDALEAQRALGYDSPAPPDDAKGGG